MIGFTAPHFAATEAGTEIIEQGGTAIEAMVAAAATIAVVYPHMNGLGGDGFWLISEPGKAPVAIDAAGSAARLATPEFYQGDTTIPSRGGKAALTMAGAVSGWQTALDISSGWQPAKSLQDILGHSIQQAQHGITVTQSLEDASNKTFDEFQHFKEFEVFRNNGKALKSNEQLMLSQLGNTLQTLTDEGLTAFYQGDMGRTIATELQAAGAPIRHADFLNYAAQIVTPLNVNISNARLFNLPAPTQGVASLMILALFDRVKHLAISKSDTIHLLVECTKQAFIVRNQAVTDVSRLPAPLEGFLDDELLDQLADKVSLQKALPWPYEAQHGDTIWMGACDNQGRMVSYIQSLYWEFGSGIVSPSTGIVWNNRGTSFSLSPDSNQYLQPGLKPFHTLNPAYAEYYDGSRMVYGTMGGEGQPQTQAVLFSRFSFLQKSLSEAIALPRWLLGRTWGDVSHNLKIEEDLHPDIIHDLISRGHDIASVPANSEMMGHAGAVHLNTAGNITSATDPRSDGLAICR